MVPSASKDGHSLSCTIVGDTRVVLLILSGPSSDTKSNITSLVDTDTPFPKEARYNNNEGTDDPLHLAEGNRLSGSNWCDNTSTSKLRWYASVAVDLPKNTDSRDEVFAIVGTRGGLHGLTTDRITQIVGESLRAGGVVGAASMETAAQKLSEICTGQNRFRDSMVVVSCVAPGTGGAMVSENVSSTQPTSNISGIHGSFA